MPSNTPEAYTRWLTEPSIVVDPGLFQEPVRPSARPLVSVTSFTLRTMASVGVLGVTIFAVAHADQWLAFGHGSAHAAEPRAAVGEYTEAMVQAARPAPLPAPLPVVEPLVEAAPDAAPQIEALSSPVAVAAVAAEPVAQPRARASAADASDAKEEALRDTLRTARRLLARRHLDEAAAAYESVLAVRSSHPAALSGLARVSLARGELQDALRYARLGVEAAPSHAVYHVTLGDVLRARFELPAADAEYALAARLRRPTERAVKALPDNPF